MDADQRIPRATLRPSLTLDLLARQLRRFVWSPLGDVIAIGFEGGDIELKSVDGPDKYSRIFSTSHGIINALSWDSTGETLAVGSTSISLLSTHSGERRKTFLGHSTSVWGLAWIADNRSLVSASYDKSLCIWDTGPTSGLDVVLHGHSGEVRVLAASPDQTLVASGSDDCSVGIWSHKSLRHLLKSHNAPITSLVWADDSLTLFSGSEDSTITVWDAVTGLALRVLEGHTSAITFVGLSPAHDVLISISSDGTMIAWALETFERVASVPLLGVASRFDHGVDVAALNPSGSVIALANPNLRQLNCYTVQDLLVHAKQFENPKTEFYRNAKVMLVGETGVGKSGLSLVLTGQPFVATESTHARKVYTYSSTEHLNADGTVERRETLLWDLAGQPDYRLVHQLHLGQVSLALVVFDARPGTEPLTGVVPWIRCLEQAKRLSCHENYPFRRILVGAREDVGRVPLTPETVSAIKKKFGFDDFIRTSAKEDWGVRELRQCIENFISWDSLPKASSNETFQQIKSFIISTKASGSVLVEIDSLYRKFLSVFPDLSLRADSQAEFTTCIGLLESRDLVHRLSFGGYLLLQPELLDAYASAIINAAKDDPKGIGTITDSEIYDGLFRMPADLRVGDRSDESILLHATVEELLRYEVAYRDGSLLVFPSQFVREAPELLDPEERDIVFRFDGNMLNIFATLVVRLAQSGQFKRPDIYRRLVQFDLLDGGGFGISANDCGGGNGEIATYFDRLVTESKRNQLNTFVHAHLLRKAVADSVRFERAYKCSNPVCAVHFTDEQLRRCRELLKPTIRCSVCEELSPVPECDSVELSRLVAIVQLDAAADKAGHDQLAKARIDSRRSVGDYDVWILYNSVDRTLARSLARKLINRGVLPWFDQWDVTPGSDSGSQLTKAILKLKACICLVGRKSLVPWDNKVAGGFIDYLVARNRPVVPFLMSDSSAESVGGYAKPPEIPKSFKAAGWLDQRAKKGLDLEELLHHLGLAAPTGTIGGADLPQSAREHAVNANRLQKTLGAVPKGTMGATHFHACVREVFDCLFGGKLARGQSEVPLDGGSKRVDLVYENIDQSGFFYSLRDRFGIHAPYIFVECKNYSFDLSTPELDQLAGRLNSKRGNVGVLVCREVDNVSGLLNRLQRYFSGEQKLLLVLKDTDLAIMLRLQADAKPDLVDDHLSAVARKIILS